MHRAQRMLGRRVGVWLAAVLVLSACTDGASESGGPQPSPSSRSASSSASSAGASPSSSAPQPGSDRAPRVRIEVLSANVRAGSRHQRPLDIEGGDDRAAFGRRVFGKGLGKPPDVIMLQETLGSSRKTLRTLNRHPRARRVGARYAIAQGPDQRRGVVRCDGRRRPSLLIRDTTTLVNVRTVGRVIDTGAFRTWGKWKPRPGRRATGCAEQGVGAGRRARERRLRAPPGEPPSGTR